jgi:hypothetical protein
LAYTTSQQAPSNAVNVRAYKASRFAPYSGMPTFPSSGSAPASPDVADAPVNPPAYFTVTLPTNEPYIVCFIDNNGKVRSHVSVQFNPAPVIGPLIVGAGVGAPSMTPVGPMIYVQMDGAAGSRLWVYPSAAIGWVAATGI